jgi:uncharacterized protein YbbK (DUF523 family)
MCLDRIEMQPVDGGSTRGHGVSPVSALPDFRRIVNNERRVPEMMGCRYLSELPPGARILVSACLLGVSCRYDGGASADSRVAALAGRFALIPVCPEQLGGLPTPRRCVELVSGRAMSRDGLDLTEAFSRGAAQALHIARMTGVRAAVLKPRSPSCGINLIYDGTFSGTLVPGLGMLADLLAREGLALIAPDDLEGTG